MCACVHACVCTNFTSGCYRLDFTRLLCLVVTRNCSHYEHRRLLLSLIAPVPAAPLTRPQSLLPIINHITGVPVFTSNSVQASPVAAIRSASLQLLLMQGGWAAGQERRREGPQAVHQYQRVQLAAARQQEPKTRLLLLNQQCSTSTSTLSLRQPNSRGHGYLQGRA
eukprot:1158469-Pelagomonas_calceolata.AAC.11